MIKPITLYIPIAETVVEQPFKFCGTTIENISEAMINKMAEIVETFPADQQKKVSEFYEGIRKDFQGYAAVKVVMECEPNYAIDSSLEIAKRVTDLLGIYTGAILTSDQRCFSKIKGIENVEQLTTIYFVEGRQHINTKFMGRSPKLVSISTADLELYRKCGLDIISDIVIKPKPTDFEKAILSMAYLYSKAAFTSDPMSKVVYVLSALESTLLKNHSEPITQNLSDRLAIFIGQELEERKTIVKNIKAIYGIRSKYLHHGYTDDEQSDLSQFFTFAWVFFVMLVTNSKNFSTKIDFLNWIEDKKFS